MCLIESIGYLSNQPMLFCAQHGGSDWFELGAQELIVRTAKLRLIAKPHLEKILQLLNFAWQRFCDQHLVRNRAEHSIDLRSNPSILKPIKIAPRAAHCL